jgi:hypothetical protein
MAIPVHAFPYPPGAEVGHFAAIAMGANRTIGPSHRRDKINAYVDVSEVSGGLQKAFWECFVFHSKAMMR